jgi:rhamnopyranosyl-N-acetylglucosaminyl-diphospho-decaprenol beta-1,3/1,4-galactofuranosyltransferase
MDDDTIARPDSLQRLLDAPKLVPHGARPALLLASKVVWSDGRTHPMNVPGYRRNRAARAMAEDRRRLAPLRYASFVSLLVHSDAVERHGLPLKHYFIWSDDIEFTARVLRDEDVGYLVQESVVVHKTQEPYTAVSTTGDRFYFHIRNHVLMLRGTSWAWWEKPTLVYKMLATSLSYMWRNHWRLRHARIIGRGLRDGIRDTPLVP